MAADPLRVLIVGLNYAPEPSGSAPYTAGLGAELAARGHDVKVVTTHPHYPQWRVEHDGPRDLTERLDGVTVRRLGTYVPSQPRAPHRFAYELLFGARAALSRLPEADVISMGNILHDWDDKESLAILAWLEALDRRNLLGKVYQLIKFWPPQ